MFIKMKGGFIMQGKKEFKPYIPADKVMPEFTPFAIIVGSLLAIVFGAANAYLGLRVGLTVSASIPAAVISMGIVRVIFNRNSILENNTVQTIGSAGESLAAGAIFTMPALFMWAEERNVAPPSILMISLVALCGGLLGAFLMIPLRNALIVEEHGTLPYPEGTACAEVLIAGEEGGVKTATVFKGLGIAALYKFVTDGLKLFPSEADFDFSKTGFTAGIGVDVLPALAGVGYICGPKIAAYMLSGATLAWLVLIPLIALFGANATIYPADVPIAELGVWGIWSKYIRYVGAGAVATGGMISLIKSFPMIIRTFMAAVKVFGKKASHQLRTEKDISMPIILGAVLIIAFALYLIPFIPLNLFGALITIIFGFFFATVSARMVGIVGSSNNPVSGMSIATLLVATLLLKATGNVGFPGMISAITIGSIICIIAAMAGDTSQDLKSGYLVGATPYKQQYGEILGAVVSAIAIGGILYLLHAAYKYGSKELPAPQATLMKLVIEGVMDGNLPWPLVISGMFIAIAVEVIGIPVLPFAIGLYLPIHLSTPIMAGGVVRLIVDKRKHKNEEEKKEAVERGILYTSGMIAGEGLLGILLAILAVIPMSGMVNGAEIKSAGDFVANILPFKFTGMAGNIAGLVFFTGMLFLIHRATLKKD